MSPSRKPGRRSGRPDQNGQPSAIRPDPYDRDRLGRRGVGQRREPSFNGQLAASPELAPCTLACCPLALRNVILLPMSASTTSSPLVDPHQQTVLRQLIQAGERGDKKARQIAQRARIVLLASEGHSLEDIARQEGISMRTAWVWRADFMRDGVPALTPKRCNPPPVISINDQQRAALEELLVAGRSGNKRAQMIARRAKAILLAAQGTIFTDICRELDVGPSSVAMWFERFARLGMDAITKVRTYAPVLQPTAQQRRELQRLVRAGRNGDNVDQDLAMRHCHQPRVRARSTLVVNWAYRQRRYGVGWSNLCVWACRASHPGSVRQRWCYRLIAASEPS